MSRGSLAFGPHLNLTAAKTDIPSALEKVGCAKGGRGKRWAGPRGKSLTNPVWWKTFTSQQANYLRFVF